jgi:hypothetical protein
MGGRVAIRFGGLVSDAIVIVAPKANRLNPATSFEPRDGRELETLVIVKKQQASADARFLQNVRFEVWTPEIA